jgi:Cys-rich repeat protein
VLRRDLRALLLCLPLSACGSGAFHPCSSDRDCLSPQVCAGGVCAQPACGAGAPTCSSDSGCAKGQHCASGCCAAGASGTCTRDADCASNAAAPVCDTARSICVACLTSRDCGAGRTCAAGVCTGAAGCYSSSDCKDAALPLCDVVSRTCVQCLDSSDCTDASRPTCDAAHTCVGSAGCTSDAACTSAGLPRCLVASGRCVACLSGKDCSGGYACSAANQCVPPAATTCVSDVDCASNPGGSHCKPATATSPGACVACLSDDQCPGGDYCEQGSDTCQIKQCSADADCAGNPSTPKCNTAGTPRLCVACLTSADCANGGTCQPDHTCQAPLPKCKADADCAANVAAPHCKLVPSGANLCVACRAGSDCGSGVTCPNDCGAGQACTAATNTCALASCSADADCTDPKKPHCQPGSGGAVGTCVQCTAASQCGAGYKCAQGACAPVCTAATEGADCSAPTPRCKESPGGNACVQCLADADCSGQTPVCSAANTCIAKPAAGCASNADCPAGQHVCDTSTSPHACVQCLATSDCTGGDLCNTSTKTCAPPPTGGQGQACKAGGVCDSGLLCVDEGGPAPVCRQLCDPTLQGPCAAVDPGFVCEWLAFDAAKALYGVCTARNGHGALGAACDPAKADSCEWDLLCAPTSATAGVCRALCSPGGACASGSCNPIVGALDSSGAALPMAYCGPPSKWGAACTTDTGSAGADCGSPLASAGAGGLFCTPSTLPAEVPLASVTTLCQYTPAAATATGGASASCSALGGDACRTGVCLADGTATCFAGCQYNADCARDGAGSGTYCFDVHLYASTADGVAATCLPTCRDAADCRASAACVPEPNHGGNSWRAVCTPAAGAGGAGGSCTGGADCQSGVCITAASAESIGMGQTLPGCTATDGFCLGSCLPSVPGDCPAAGTTCRIDVALPLSPRDTGDKGAAGRPNPGICWGAGCSTDSNCAGLSADAATPRVCAPYKATSSASIDATKKCALDSDCAGSSSWQAVCNVTSNNPNPAGAYGTSAGIYGPNGHCRAVTWGLACAPSLGAAKGGPGAACSAATDCRTGHCVTLGTQQYCFGGCSSDAECASGTHCRTGTYLGLAGTHCAP